MTDEPATRPHPETYEPLADAPRRRDGAGDTPASAASERREDVPADAPATLRAQLAQPVVVPRWVQLVLLPLGLLGLWGLARAAGPVLVIFLIAGIIALILNPLVSLLQRRLRFPRGLAVAAVYLGFFIALAGVGFLLANPVADQIAAFQADVPGLVDDATATLDDVQVWFDDKGIDAKVSEQGSTALQTLQKNLLRRSGDLVAFTRDLLQRIVEATLALALILVVSIYMLLYGARIGARVRSIMPPGNGTPEDDYPTRVQRALFGYVRGQLLFSLAMGTGAGVALWLFGAIGIFPDGKTYALFFGAFFGLMELVPYLGPIIGALPPIIVALLQDPLTAPPHRPLGHAALRRASAGRGPRRRPSLLRPGPAHQPPAGDLLARPGGPALRDRRRAHGPSSGGDRAGDRRLPSGPSGPRAVGNAHRRGDIRRRTSSSSSGAGSASRRGAAGGGARGRGPSVA